jgi:serine/threonine protein kinase/WD40 repeat protein
MTDLSQEREIFQASIELPAAQRSDFVRRACEGMPSLELRIRRLLAAHEKAAALVLRTGSGPVPALEPPRRIGPYTLLQLLGEGGMGAVYEAEQAEPVRRLVALKIVRWGIDSTQILARFDAERQALAVMDHPGIAKVFDGGIAPTGQPYFVMELVRGLPFTEYCNRNRIGLRQRLELFAELCEAVQHAHQKGIIHRDLKPSNVLVAEPDGRPIPRVIDFGISKALGQSPAEMTLITLHGQTLGTPAYMSPEQADPGAKDIDTRSDIYSLGIMLYETLAGTLPVNPADLGVHEYLARLSRQEIDPPAPSAMLARPGDQGRDAAALLGTDTITLRRELRGDLDWVVMKAIEKDRSRRYPTAKALADDLRRFLDSEPILARPPARGYRLRKFVHRHRAGVAAAAAVALAVILGAAASGAGFLRATRAEREARREADRAQGAESAALQRLRDSLIAQARANRRTREPGRRHRTLDLLAQAAAIQPGADIRDEAVAAMALTDLKVVAEWPQPSPVDFDRQGERFLEAADGGGLALRSVTDPRFLVPLPGAGPLYGETRFSRGGRYMLVNHHGGGIDDPPSVRVWDMSSGRLTFESREIVPSRAMDLDASARRVATAASDGRVRIRDIRTGVETASFPLKERVYMLRFRPDGDALALALEKGGIEIRDLSGRVVRTFDIPGIIYAVDWSDDGRLLAAGREDRAATVWDAASGAVVANFLGHQAEVVDVFLSPGAELAATYSWDETSRVWDARTGEELLVLGSCIKGFTDDGRRAPFASDRTAGLMDVLHGDFFHYLKGHTGKSPRAMAVRHDGRVLASGGEDGTLLWDLERNRLLGPVPTGPVTEVHFEPGGPKLFSCGDKGLVRWSFSITGEGLARTTGEPLASGPCVRSSLAAQGDAIAYTGEGRIRVMNGKSGRVVKLIEGFRGMDALSMSPDGRWLAGGNWRGTVAQAWDLADGGPIVNLARETPSVSVRFSPGGKWLVAGTSRDYRVWSVSPWKEIRRIPRPVVISNLPGIMDISSDDTMMALLMNHKLIQIFEVESGKLLLSLEPPAPEACSALQFTPDQARLLATTHGNRILIWELRRIREQLKRLRLI